MQRDEGKYPYTSFKYEFPGGKIEQGELKSEALMRELREEMDYDIEIHEADFFDTVTYAYPDFEITMYCFLCHVNTDVFNRKEHINHLWLAPEEMSTLDWAAADYPIVKTVIDYYSKKK